MKQFAYVRPKTIAEAVAAAAEPGAVYLAGGTNLLDLMKGGVSRPDRLVDVTHLTGLDEIQHLPGGAVRIGALVGNAELAHDREFARRFPAVAEALLSGASAQLRNAATVGGNLLQRTRCAYFYDVVTPCNKRQPGSGCSAIEGLNRGHAILGTSNACIAVHPSDMCVAMRILDATVHVTGPAGDRAIPIADFHRLPGDTAQRDTDLEAGEIITAVELPAQGFAANHTYLKIRDRLSYAFALVSVSAGLELDGDTIKEGRFALGGVAHKPWRDPEAEAVLRGQPADETTFAHAADVLLRDARGYRDNTFKIDLARRCIVRGLTQAARGTPQSQSRKKIA